MLHFKIVQDSAGNKTLLTSVSGKALLTIPQLNKSTAFSEQERLEFGLIGKLPPRIETLEDQVARAYLQYRGQESEILKNNYLTYLLNVNQVLFYKLLSQYTEEMLPQIYTPIVGSAVEQFSQRFFQPRGLYISYEDQDRIEMILNNRSNLNVNLIVVSDGEGVLGIGDQGAGAMAIPVAKLMVYTAFGGIDPNNTLPIMLDVGTNNKNLLNDPLYLGWRHPRISGKDYDIFINKFVAAVKNLFPNIFLHWEDFGSYNSYNNLANYRYEICSFNDDIQGTGVVTVAALLAACVQTQTTLADQRIVVFGAGSAGMGVTDSIYKTMLAQGLTANEARDKFWLIDRLGLLTDETNQHTIAQTPFIRKKEVIQHWKVKDVKNISLLEVIENVHPSILIGCSTVGNAFNQTIVETMGQYVERPIIFPLSNPTEKAEAKPEDLIKWTQGRALIATGSPFPDVEWHKQSFSISQCNNYFAFPGIGLGVLLAKAKEVSEGMLLAASSALCEVSTQQKGRLLPSIDHLSLAAKEIAKSVIITAINEGLAQIELNDDISQLIENNMWKPQYFPYKKVEN